MGFPPSPSAAQKAGYLDLARTAIFVRDVDGKIVYWNSDAARTYGWSSQEALGQNSHDLLSTVFPLALETINAQLLEQGFWEGELVHRTRNGDSVTVLSSWKLTWMDGGLRSVLECNRDISELKRMEQELRDSQAALEERVAARTVELVAANDALRREIAERERAEGRLAKLFIEVEKRAAELDAIFSSLPDAIYVGTEAGIHRCNQVAVEMLGFGSKSDLENEIPILAEQIQTRFAETGQIIPIDEQPFVRALRGESCIREVSVRNLRSGEQLVVRSASAPIRIEGQVVGAVAVNTDITEQRRAREELQHSQTRLRLALDAAGMVVWEWDVTSGVMYASGNTEQLLGIPAGELLDHAQYLNLIHPADRSRVAARREYSSAGQADFSEEYRIVCPDGSVRWVIDQGRSLGFQTGRKSVLAGVLMDVTDRRASDDALRESDERFRLLAENISDVFWIIDAETRRFHYASPSFEQLSGIDPAELFENRCAWAELTHPADRDRVEKAFQYSLSTGRFDEEYRIVRPNGEERWVRDRGVLLTSHPIYGRRIVGVTTDTTERKLAEVALTQKAEELVQSNADLQQFAYVTSHDLQEPLRTMISFSQLLVNRYRGKLDGDADEFLGYIVSGAQRMKGLIEALLSYSRVVSAESLPLGPVPLAPAIHWATMNLQAVIEESGAQITLDPMPPVCGDQVQLVQLLQNLIGNAIKYRKPGVPPHIHFSAEQNGDEIVVAVRDNGIGISPEHAQRIFGVFKRLHGREIPGTGIGLAICKRIVERLGGRIWVESAPQQGSTFYFTLRVP